MNNEKIGFAKINWGADAAEQDFNLNSYFYKIQRFDEILDGRVRYIVGRKGTGKTAIFEKLKSDFDNESLKSVISLSFGDFPLNDLFSIKDKSAGDKYQYIPIWRFLILTELSKKILRDQSVIQHEHISLITSFLNQNFPEHFTISDTVNYLRSNQSKLNISPNFFQIEDSRKDEKSFSGRIHYKKAADYLMKILSNIKPEVTYYILFDGLDEGFKSANKSLNLLLISLIGAIEKLSIDFHYTAFKFRPLLALRPDVLSSIGSNNLNKIDDYKLNLKWNANNLKDLISLRIGASLKDVAENLFVNDIWRLVVSEEDNPFKLWTYIVDRSLQRPRDVIKFLKYCQRTNIPYNDGKISKEHVTNAELDYSDWLYNEYKDEIFSIMPIDIWADSMECFSIVGKKIPYKNEIIDELKKDKSIKAWVEREKKDFDDILKVLYNYSIIGGFTGSKRYIFNYKDKSKWRSFSRVAVHLGLHKRLNLTKRNFFLVSGLILDKSFDGNFKEYFSFNNQIFSVETEYFKSENHFNAYIKFDISSVKNINITENLKIELTAQILSFNKTKIPEITFSLNNGTRSYKRIIDLIKGDITETFIRLDGNIAIGNDSNSLNEKITITTNQLKEKLKNAKYIKFVGKIKT